MVEIYNKGLLPSAQQFNRKRKRNWLLLEDGDPKHTSKLSKAWKAENQINVLEWPANSPDCNLIENDSIKQRKIITKNGLIRAIKEEWQSLTTEYTQKLAESDTQRYESVIANQGDWISY